jgi:hypothetical protein
MALETATTIAALVATNPTTSDKRKEGDDHLRMIKTCLVALSRTVLYGAVTTHSGTTGTAVAGQINLCTNAGAVTMTLPASPTAGDLCAFIFTNGGTTNVLARNGSPIQTAASDKTLSGYVAGTLTSWRYIDSTRGWLEQ